MPAGICTRLGIPSRTLIVNSVQPACSVGMQVLTAPHNLESTALSVAREFLTRGLGVSLLFVLCCARARGRLNK